MRQYIYLKTTDDKLLATSRGNLLSVGYKDVTAHHRGLWSIGYTANIKVVGPNGEDAYNPITGEPEDWTNTFDEYGLVVTNNDVIDTPKVDTYYVTVTGSSRVLDLSEYVANRPSYGQRKLTLDFAFEMDPDFCMTYFSEFLNRYHGRRAQFVLDIDPDWCYEGRITVGQLKRKLSLCQFTLTADCDPKKYAATEDVLPWHYIVDKTESRL